MKSTDREPKQSPFCIPDPRLRSEHGPRLGRVVLRRSKTRSAPTRERRGRRRKARGGGGWKKVKRPAWKVKLKTKEIVLPIVIFIILVGHVMRPLARSAFAEKGPRRYQVSRLGRAFRFHSSSALPDGSRPPMQVGNTVFRPFESVVIIDSGQNRWNRYISMHSNGRKTALPTCKIL